MNNNDNDNNVLPMLIYWYPRAARPVDTIASAA